MTRSARNCPKGRNARPAVIRGGSRTRMRVTRAPALPRQAGRYRLGLWRRKRNGWAVHVGVSAARLPRAEADKAEGPEVLPGVLAGADKGCRPLRGEARAEG